jgi:membrane protease YdiL (CAAX protease family)
MPAVPAILITSVLFGIMHGQWKVGVTVFAMSIGMCVMRELTGTIWSGIILHMIKNGIAFFFLFVA